MSAWNNSIINFDFNGIDDTPYRLQFVAGKTTDLSSPDTYDFPVNLLDIDTIETDWGFSDKTPTGLLNVGTLKLKIDVSELTGDNGSEVGFWDDVRQAIVRGGSTDTRTIETVNTKRIPNRWTLKSGASYTKTEFDGLQIFNPDKRYELTNYSVHIDIDIQDTFSTILKNIAPTTSGINVTGRLTTTIQPLYDIYDNFYKTGSNFTYVMLFGFLDKYCTFNNLWYWIRDGIQSYLRAYLRDSTLTFHTNTTKGDNQTNNSQPLDHVTLYKHDITTDTGVVGDTLDGTTLLVQYTSSFNLLTADPTAPYTEGNYGLLNPINEEGWIEYKTLYDVLKLEAEYLHCKGLVDLNPASGSLSLSYHRVFDMVSTLPANIKTIDKTNTFNKSLVFQQPPHIVGVTTNYKNVINNGINQFKEEVVSTVSEDTLELQGIWQNCGNKSSPKTLSQSIPGGNFRFVRFFGAPPARNLYYSITGGVIAGATVIRIHDNATINLGGATIAEIGSDITVSEYADPEYYTGNTGNPTVAGWRVNRYDAKLNTNASNTGLGRICAKAGMALFNNEDQLLLDFEVEKATADNSMLGDVYIVDLDSFLPNGAYLNAVHGTTAVLVNVKVNYYQGTSIATFWVRG